MRCCVALFSRWSDAQEVHRSHVVELGDQGGGELTAEDLTRAYMIRGIAAGASVVLMSMRHEAAVEINTDE